MNAWLTIFPNVSEKEDSKIVECKDGGDQLPSFKLSQMNKAGLNSCGKPTSGHLTQHHDVMCSVVCFLGFALSELLC